MKLTFIGTGSGKTGVDRFHSSLLISFGGFELLVDAGDGISKALLLKGINYNEIDAVLFSHYHADHFAGIALLFTQMKLSGRTSKLKLFTHRSLVDPLINFLNYTYLFLDSADFETEIVPFDFGNKNVITKKFAFTAKQNKHIQNKKGIETENISFVSSSFMFEVNGKKINYTSDVGTPEDLLLFKDEKLDLFITETTHIGLDEIYNAALILNASKIFLTHIEEDVENEIKNWLTKLNNDKFVLAEDGLKIDL